MDQKFFIKNISNKFAYFYYLRAYFCFVGCQYLSKFNYKLDWAYYKPPRNLLKKN